MQGERGRTLATCDIQVSEKKIKKIKACFSPGLYENGLDGERRACSQPFHSRRAQMPAISMETKKSMRVFLGKELVGERGGLCLGGMINESTPCCHLYFGIQSKAQFSVKYYSGLSRQQSLMLMYE